jgi:ribosomal-protein-alanine N-acetyltransferase
LAFFDWQSDVKVAKYLTWLPKTEKESRQDLADIVAQQTRPDRDKFFYAIVLLESGEVIGDTGITRTGPRTGDMGWFIRHKYWGNNYATEAAQLMVRVGLEHLHLKTIRASCNGQNKASERLMQKTGFSLVEEKNGRLLYQINTP